VLPSDATFFVVVLLAGAFFTGASAVSLATFLVVVLGFFTTVFS